jgi:hypothetical protein
MAFAFKHVYDGRDKPVGDIPKAIEGWDSYKVWGWRMFFEIEGGYFVGGQISF